MLILHLSICHLWVLFTWEQRTVASIAQDSSTAQPGIGWLFFGNLAHLYPPGSLDASLSGPEAFSVRDSVNIHPLEAHSIQYFMNAHRSMVPHYSQVEEAMESAVSAAYSLSAQLALGLAGLSKRTPVHDAVIASGKLQIQLHRVMSSLRICLTHAAAATPQGASSDREGLWEQDSPNDLHESFVQSYRELNMHINISWQSILATSDIFRSINAHAWLTTAAASGHDASASLALAADAALQFSQGLALTGRMLFWRMCVDWAHASRLTLSRPWLYRWDLCCRRWEVLAALLRGLRREAARLQQTRPMRFLEVGTASGLTTLFLLEHLPWLEAIAVDPYELAANLQGTGRSAAHLTQQRQQVEKHFTSYGARAELRRAFSLDAAASIPDSHLDLVFIDGNHSLTAVAADLEVWATKLRPGGVLAGHDYSMSLPEVVQAVHSAGGTSEVHLAADSIYFWRI